MRSSNSSHSAVVRVIAISAILLVDPIDIFRACDRIPDRELFNAFGMADGFEKGAPVFSGVGQHGQPAIFGAHRPPLFHALVAGRSDRRDRRRGHPAFRCC